MQSIKVKKMGVAKWAYNFFNALALSVWGITIIDLLTVVVGSEVSLVSGVDSGVKITMAIAGAIYFIVKGAIELPHKYRMQKLDLEKKKRELDESKKGSKKSTAP